MNFLLWLIVGGLIGWVASLIMKTDAQQGLVLNVVVGIVGAFLAGLLISPLLGISTINQGSLSLPSLLVSLCGAVLLIFVVNLVRRRA
ncbi:MAG: GlsB/YeaQ/YmgE family stress response membrane protein [Gemmatimonadota bacterium]